MGLFVDDAQIEHWQMPTLDLDVINKQSVLLNSGIHSFQVIPGTIPAEFEFCSKFCRNHLINLAGPSAKFDSSRIPGIARILPDSGWNQWRTIKTLISSLLSPSSINTGGHYFCEHRNILTCETG